ncbi:hypothetical protein DPM19_30430 [Actinomadura craniellae]|uniref:Uncharacterized protein n=1 Tax=Actinomadura craniellae TaxID=2231787 RepID=A0A365GZG9_9ACTN|nr:hypothetical protein [Actinomadura craniellae]RAY11343.1 hypothetical protein DPM19_30430 [Actinomadura craniellae]
MFLAQPSPIGDNYWLFLGPLIVVLGLITWVFILMRVARRKPDYTHSRGEAAHRGVVSGGIIEGDPGQRNRVDEINPEEEEAARREDSRREG